MRLFILSGALFIALLSIIASRSDIDGVDKVWERREEAYARKQVIAEIDTKLMGCDAIMSAGTKQKLQSAGQLVVLKTEKAKVEVADGNKTNLHPEVAIASITIPTHNLANEELVIPNVQIYAIGIFVRLKIHSKIILFHY